MANCQDIETSNRPKPNVIKIYTTSKEEGTDYTNPQTYDQQKTMRRELYKHIT
jgi:hypothetical protein